MTLGKIIKNYRTEHDLSMQDFADLIRSSKSYVSMLEKNINPSTNKPISPSIETLKSIALAMNVNVETLLKQLDENQLIYLDENEFKKQFDSNEFDLIMSKCGQRLRECRESLNLTIEYLADKFSVNKNKFLRWEDGITSDIGNDIIYQLSVFYDVSPSWLMGMSDTKYVNKESFAKKMIKIPVLGTIPAGVAIEAVEDIIEYAEIPSDWLKGR